MTQGSTDRLPRLVLAAFAVVLVATVLVAGATTTTAFGAYSTTWDGASQLRAAADATETPTTIVRNTATYRTASADAVAVILSPSSAYAPGQRADVRAFVRNGGTLLVAEDFRPHANDLLASLGVASRFDGRLVRDERHYYKGAALPVATNLTAHPLTNRSESLTLNYATVVDPGPNATVLASTSGFAYLDENRNARLDATETIDARPVVVQEQVGAGRVILVSDPSMFVNAMLDRPGNAAFVRALFARHDALLLDTTHAGASLPPLRLAVLVLRASPALQLLAVGAVVAFAAAWEQGVHRRVAARLRDDDPVVSLSRARIVAAVEDAHPEWDRDRVERLVDKLITSTENVQADD